MKHVGTCSQKKKKMKANKSFNSERQKPKMYDINKSKMNTNWKAKTWAYNPRKKGIFFGSGERQEKHEEQTDSSIQKYECQLCFQIRQK